MGVAWFIVPEREIDGLDTFVTGKPLAHVKHPERLARAAGVRPLMDFFSQGPGDLLDLLGEEGDDGELHLPDGVAPPTVAWFDAADGLAAVRGLLRHLADHPDAIAGSAAVVEDLRGFEEVLAALDREGVRWHLAIDI
jgi:hypothetical protein